MIWECLRHMSSQKTFLLSPSALTALIGSVYIPVGCNTGGRVYQRLSHSPIPPTCLKSQPLVPSVLLVIRDLAVFSSDDLEAPQDSATSDISPRKSGIPTGHDWRMDRWYPMPWASLCWWIQHIGNIGNRGSSVPDPPQPPPPIRASVLLAIATHIQLALLEYSEEEGELVAMVLTVLGAISSPKKVVTPSFSCLSGDFK